MAQNRKTRAQKAQAASRRRRQLQQLTVKKPATKTNPASVSATKRPMNVTTALRQSLRLLAILLLLQLGLWLLINWDLLERLK